jgi:uncharacterized membrane protein YraQ (UPF0718 family)
MSYSWPHGAADMKMTSVIDGLTHTVAANEFDAGIWRGQGNYRAACGAEVVAAALVTGPGPRCSNCAAIPTIGNADRELQRGTRTAWLRAVFAALPGLNVSDPRMEP